jgi:hypothetical protein
MLWSAKILYICDGNVILCLQIIYYCNKNKDIYGYGYGLM